MRIRVTAEEGQHALQSWAALRWGDGFEGKYAPEAPNLSLVVVCDWSTRENEPLTVGALDANVSRIPVASASRRRILTDGDCLPPSSRAIAGIRTIGDKTGDIFLNGEASGGVFKPKNSNNFRTRHDESVRYCCLLTPSNEKRPCRRGKHTEGIRRSARWNGFSRHEKIITENGGK